MHDLLWFCRSNFLDWPTLIFTRLSTSFLENRTVFGGSFSHVRPKKLLTFPCNGTNPCMSPSCLPLHANRSKLRKLDFFIGYPSVCSPLRFIRKKLYLLKNTSDCFSWTFHLSSLPDEQLDDAVKKVKARHPAAGEMGVKVHLIIEGILVHRQRHIRDCLRRVASEAGPD